MDRLYDVIIAGGGPIGLFLACELGLAGTSVLVLERNISASSAWKTDLGSRGLNSVSIEALYRRGLLYKVFDSKKRPESFQQTTGYQRGGHFAGIMLDSNKLDLKQYKYRINGPAISPGPTNILHLETVLAERAESLGVTILRGHGVTEIVSQDEDSVTVMAGENQTFRGSWLIGADGGRSRVRKLAGFEFIGTDAKFTGYAVKCSFDSEKLKMGFNPTKNGMYILGGPEQLWLIDFDGGAFDRSQEISTSHIQDVCNRVTGITDLNITQVHIASAFTDRSKQATKYRKGRILLAGDAAHIHSPLGSQGLNLGIGDAINLGWKLAATIRREAASPGVLPDLQLLDTYEAERHPIAKWVLEWTRAQVATLEPTPSGVAIQSLVRDMILTIDGNNLFIDRVWGLSQRYDLNHGQTQIHPLVGSTAPDFELIDGSRLGSRLEKGHGLLVALGDDIALNELVKGKYDARVEYVRMAVKDRRGLRALLIRPDGAVAWAMDEGSEPDQDGLRASLQRWFAY